MTVSASRTATGWRGVMQVGLIPVACGAHEHQPHFIEEFPGVPALREPRWAANFAMSAVIS